MTTLNYQINPALRRLTIEGFHFPLGWIPHDGKRPLEGYTLALQQSEETDVPDTLQFHIIISHERMTGLLSALMDLLPALVYPVLEANSRDAYRQVDSMMGASAIPVGDFRSIWKQFEPVLIEDGTVGAGAMSEDPYIEIFVNEYKAIIVIVDTSRSREIESILNQAGLQEVPQHWADDSGEDELLSILTEDDDSLNIDDVIIHLQWAWGLELNVDLEGNPDENGKELGVTLWHVLALASCQDPKYLNEAGHVEIWLSAGSLGQVEELVAGVFEQLSGQWKLEALVSQDRVAFDDRPESLSQLAPASDETGILQVDVHRNGEC